MTEDERISGDILEDIRKVAQAYGFNLTDFSGEVRITRVAGKPHLARIRITLEKP